MTENRHESQEPTERPTPAGNELAGRTVAVVLAGGKGTRLDPLTRNTCKPALPFGGTYRCIDFSLSNCVSSGIRTIGVATRYKPAALLAHLETRWNSAAAGHDTVVHAWRAEEHADRFGACGTADAVYRNLDLIRRRSDTLVLVLAGDHVYKMDYRPMLEAHCVRNAAVTIGCIETPIEDACRLGALAVGNDGRVERFVEKPRCPADVPGTTGDRALSSMGIYVFDAAYLARILLLDAARTASGHDFAEDILPPLIARDRVYAYPFRAADGSPAYWRDVGTLAAYWQAHMDLLGPTPLLTLDDPRWPLGRFAAMPHVISEMTATAGGGTVEDSIVPARCRIGGQVLRSVLCDDVEVGRGAKVAETVALPGAVIGAGSRLRGVIVDAGHRVRDGTAIERYDGAEQPPVLSAHPPNRPDSHPSDGVGPKQYSRPNL